MTIDPSEQAELFALLGGDFALMASAEPLYPSPKARPLSPMASGREIINSIRRQQKSLKQLAASVAVEKVQDELSENEIMQIHYIPLTIAELVWDYADTIIACCKGNKKIAQLSRTIRHARRCYLKAFPRQMARALESGEMLDNAYLFEEMIARQWNTMNTALLADLRTLYPDLPQEEMNVLMAAYEAIAIARALDKFVKKISGKLTRITGWDFNAGHILSKPYRAMTALLELYIGDHPASPRFNLNGWATVFANQIFLIET